MRRPVAQRVETTGQHVVRRDFLRALDEVDDTRSSGGRLCDANVVQRELSSRGRVELVESMHAHTKPVFSQACLYLYCQWPREEVVAPREVRSMRT